MLALSCDSREAVDAMNEAAANNGGMLSSTPPARFRTPTIPGRRSREHGSVTIALNSITKFVFSRTLKNVTWRNSRLLREIDPREIETMKGQPAARQSYDHFWQRLHCVAAHPARFDRRVSVRGLPDLPRKRPTVAQWRVETLAVGSLGGQATSIWRRHAYSRSVNILSGG